MSELKAYMVYTSREGVVAGFRTSGSIRIEEGAEIYLKAEADKVIAHNKYKRCLAMAEWCDAESYVADADGDYEDMKWYQKWHNKWLALAEEPTWEKFLQLIRKEAK